MALRTEVMSLTWAEKDVLFSVRLGFSGKKISYHKQLTNYSSGVSVRVGV